MHYGLRQRGLAASRFVTEIAGAYSGLHQRIEAGARAAGLTENVLADDPGERAAEIAAVVAELPAYRTMLLLREWAGRNHGRIAKAAFEEIRAEVEPQLKSLDQGPTAIIERDGFTSPSYMEGIEFHRTEGSWDGHEMMGFVHGELILRQMVARSRLDSIFQQRARVLEGLPAGSSQRILEMGTGGGPYTLPLAAHFPAAEVWGCDVSRRNLEQARRVANERKLAWTLLLARAEETGLADETFDLVTSYALLHELPQHAARELLREAFRVLQPGGTLLMADVQPYAAVDKLTAWRQDLDAAQGEDPYWRDYATTDFAALATASGFANVSWRGLAPDSYPWVLRATKPPARGLA